MAASWLVAATASAAVESAELEAPPQAARISVEMAAAIAMAARGFNV
jgi:hypothetical protein